MCIDRALRGQSPSGAKGVSEKTLYSGAGFPCVETNDSQGNPKNCPNYSHSISMNYNHIQKPVTELLMCMPIHFIFTDTNTCPCK